MDDPDLPRNLGDLTETKLDSRAVFSGNFLHVMRDSVVLPDRSIAEREYIIHPGAVVIIALTDIGELVMERQFRYPLGREFLELPAGKIDANEDPLQTAKRELSEETGYSAARWHYLGVMHPVIGYSTEHIEIYLAEELSKASAKLDQGEFLEVFSVALPVAMDWIRTGKITDAKTIVGLLWADKLRSGTWL